MADISVLARLLNGAMRNVDLTNNTPVVQSIKVGGGITNTELTKTILDNLISHLSNTSNPHSVTKTQVGLGNVDDVQQLPMSYLDIDGTLAANSDSKVASQKAVKTYVDGHAGVASSALDGTFTINNTSAPTKKIAFSAAGITAGTTKTITMPDANVDLGALTNSNISASAAIIYSKLSLSNSILNADINASAAIAYSKLALSSSIVNADVASGAAIAESKLALDYSTAGLNTAIGGKVSKSGDTMSGNLAMGSNKVTSSFVPNANDVLTNKLYVDGLMAGAVWQDPIIDPDLIDDSLTVDPGFGSVVAGDVYIAAATNGGWTAGHAYFSDGTQWIDLLGRAVIAGDRFGVSMESATAGAGGLASQNDKLAQIVSPTPGTITYTFTTPTANHAVYVSNAISTHAGHQYNYNGAAWVEFGGLVAVNAGIGLELVSNVLNVKMGAGIVQLPSDEVGVDVHTNGGLFTTIDNSSSSTATAAQLAIKLDGSTLAKGVSGVKVATGGIANNEINAAAAIAESKLALDFSTSSLNTAIGTKVTANTAITGATKTKITYDSKGLVTAGADATTADIADSSNKRYVTDAQLVVIGNTSGTNTGDQTITLTGDVTGTGTGSFATTTVRAPAIQATSEIAGDGFSASTIYAVRYGQNTETAGTLYKADLDATSVDNFYAIGIVKTSGALSATNAMPNITKFGLVTMTSHGFTVGKPVYLSASGALTSTAPSTVNYAVVKLGMVKDTNTIDVNIQVMGVN
jgi:hypothetical protein